VAPLSKMVRTSPFLRWPTAPRRPSFLRVWVWVCVSVYCGCLVDYALITNYSLGSTLQPTLANTHTHTRSRVLTHPGAQETRGFWPGLHENIGLGGLSSCNRNMYSRLPPHPVLPPPQPLDHRFCVPKINEKPPATPPICVCFLYIRFCFLFFEGPATLW